MANSTIDATLPVVDRSTFQAELDACAPFICATATIQSFALWSHHPGALRHEPCAHVLLSVDLDGTTPITSAC
jgi:hypothetical protein